MILPHYYSLTGVESYPTDRIVVNHYLVLPGAACCCLVLPAADGAAADADANDATAVTLLQSESGNYFLLSLEPLLLNVRAI